MNKQAFYAITFVTTSHVIQTERIAAKVFSISIIPTPREISRSCGISIRVDTEDELALINFIKKLSVPIKLFYMGERQMDGKRSFQMRYESQ